jgi:transposase-like protein
MTSNEGDNTGDSRNGYSEKTVLTENQSALVQAPRDRNATFEPKILPKHQRGLPIFNDQVISMYSFGMTDRDIKRTKVRRTWKRYITLRSRRN